MPWYVKYLKAFLAVITTSSRRSTERKEDKRRNPYWPGMNPIPDFGKISFRFDIMSCLDGPSFHQIRLMKFLISADYCVEKVVCQFFSSAIAFFSVAFSRDFFLLIVFTDRLGTYIVNLNITCFQPASSGMEIHNSHSIFRTRAYSLFGPAHAYSLQSSNIPCKHLCLK